MPFFRLRVSLFQFFTPSNYFGYTFITIINDRLNTKEKIEARSHYQLYGVPLFSGIMFFRGRWICVFKFIEKILVKWITKSRLLKVHIFTYSRATESLQKHQCHNSIYLTTCWCNSSSFRVIVALSWSSCSWTDDSSLWTAFILSFSSAIKEVNSLNIETTYTPTYICKCPKI